MANVASVTLTGPWSKLSSILNPAVATGAIAKEVARATRANGLIVRKAIRAELQGGVAPPNAALTTMIKRSSKPGVDNAELFKAITSVLITPWEAEIGVKKGDKEANYAVVLHEGAVIKVSPKMRSMFGYLADVSAGDRPVSSLTGRAAELYKRRPGGWKALKHSTTHIKIPARPFIANALASPVVRAKIGDNWTRAWAAGLVGKRFKART